MTEQPRKHHYIPQFWLARWASADGRMVRYEQPVAGKTVASLRYPSEVGWVKDLYRYPDDDPAKEQWLEHGVFQRIDNSAARVLDRMLDASSEALSPKELSDWALLVRSLMHRTPENLRSVKRALSLIEDHLMIEVRQHYDELRGPRDPATLAEYEASLHREERERTALRLLPDVINNQRIGTFLINMKWRIFTAPADCPKLLISDDPVARTNGIANPGGHLALPLSPSCLLVMTESEQTMRSISSLPIRELVRNMNCWTVESARRFVVAADKQQDRFIRNRFGRSPKQSLTANMGKIDAEDVTSSWLLQARLRRESRVAQRRVQS